ncbi:MAG: ABC transporter permease [Sphingobacteriia bacterium]|nr:ABC transporter permease [Sphingobacteriia bacterium]
MFGNYIKIALRNLSRQKGFSLINIVGLSIGMAAFILITMWIYHELSYDRHNQHYHRIYRFVQKQFYSTGPFTVSNMPAPIAADARRDFPEFEELFRFFDPSIVVSFEDKKFNETITMADSGIFKVFDFELLEGSLKGVFSDLYSAVITKDAAMKIFGETDVIGKTIRINNQNDFKITAVIENPPTNSTFVSNYYIPFEYLSQMGHDLTRYGWNSYFIYALMHPGVDVEQFNEKFKHYFQVVRNDETIETELSLFPLAKERLYYYDGTPTNLKSVTMFGIIAGFILLIACVNFMNLSTARASRRSREIGMRKVAGASRIDLFWQFMGESMAMSFISLIFALLLVQLLLPVFNDLTGKTLSLSLFQPITIVALIIITLVTGFIAGSYPALYLSSLQPTTVMKGGQSLRSNIWFRRGLVIFQFILSTGLIISTLVTYRQMDYMLHKDLGMNKENVLYFILRGDLLQKFDTFKGELLQNQNIKRVAVASHLPFMIGSNTGDISWEGKNTDDEVLISILFGDENLSQLMEYQLVAGRYFSKDFKTDTASVLINETAARLMGIDDPVGKWVSWGDENRLSIVGIVKDFHFQKMQSNIDPLIIFNQPERAYLGLVRINEHHTEETLEFLEEKWNAFVPAFPFQASFLDHTYKKFHLSESRLSRLIRYFTLLAIIISCLGLFGLASFTAAQKFREIGIRKVLGASVANIILLQQREFLLLVLAANVIAWPLAWFFLSEWLAGFAYKIHLHPGFFILAAFLSLLVTFFTVFFLAWHASAKNPADAIKWE